MMYFVLVDIYKIHLMMIVTLILILNEFIYLLEYLIGNFVYKVCYIFVMPCHKHLYLVSHHHRRLLRFVTMNLRNSIRNFLKLIVSQIVFVKKLGNWDYYLHNFSSSVSVYYIYYNLYIKLSVSIKQGRIIKYDDYYYYFVCQLLLFLLFFVYFIYKVMIIIFLQDLTKNYVYIYINKLKK